MSITFGAEAFERLWGLGEVMEWGPMMASATVGEGERLWALSSFIMWHTEKSPNRCWAGAGPAPLNCSLPRASSLHKLPALDDFVIHTINHGRHCYHLCLMNFLLKTIKIDGKCLLYLSSLRKLFPLFFISLWVPRFSLWSCFFWQRAPFNILFNTRQLPMNFSNFVWRISIFVFEKYFPWH